MFAVIHGEKSFMLNSVFWPFTLHNFFFFLFSLFGVDFPLSPLISFSMDPVPLISKKKRLDRASIV